MELEKIRTLIKQHEGSIPHMYLDTRGNVTVGVGLLLSAVEDAQQLPFVRRDTQAPASAEEIEADFNNIMSQKEGQLAQSYRQYTQLELTQEAIDELLDQRITEFQSGLQGAYQGFDGYPDTAKEALLDMTFNLGLSGLVNKFPKLRQAAEAGNWQICAQECKRRGISDERNQVTRTLFEQAV